MDSVKLVLDVVSAPFEFGAEIIESDFELDEDVLLESVPRVV